MKFKSELKIKHQNGLEAKMLCLKKSNNRVPEQLPKINTYQKIGSTFKNIVMVLCSAVLTFHKHSSQIFFVSIANYLCRDIM